MSTPTAAVLRTETRLFLREPGAVFMVVLFPVLLLVILGLVPSFREPSDDLGGQRVIDLYVPVAVLLAMITAAVTAMPAVVLGYRESGVLRRLRTTPADPAALLLSQAVLQAAAIVVSIVLVLAVARLGFDVALPRSGGYVLAVLLALASTVAIGALVTAAAPNPRVGQVLGMGAFFPMMFTAGVYFPVQAMTGLLHTIVVATPMGAAAEALNDARLGEFPDTADLAVMAGWTVVLVLLAARVFRRSWA